MYINRLVESDIINAIGNNKILIVLGARQVGKTTLLKKIVSQYDGKIINLDIEVEKAKFETASKLSPDEALKYLSVSNLLVIDEAHKLPDVGRIIKGWFDYGIKTKVILSGSSSLDLLNKSAESLTGRNEKIYLTPLIFSESVKSQVWYDEKLNKNRYADDLKDQSNSFLNKLLMYGSYPEIVTTEDPISKLQNLVGDYLLKDVFQSGLVRSSTNIKRLLLNLAFQIGSEISVSELATTIGVTRSTIENYLDILEKTYIIFRLPAFSTNPRKEINKSQKIYFWDIGIRNAIINDFNTIEHRADKGSIWENFIISEFAKTNLTFGNRNNLHFWRNRDGGEIDLIVKSPTKISAFEVKWKKDKLRIPKSYLNEYVSSSVDVVNSLNYFSYLL